MRYYKLYVIPVGKRKRDKVYLDQSLSKKGLEQIQIMINKMKGRAENFIITQVDEVEVS